MMTSSWSSGFGFRVEWGFWGGGFMGKGPEGVGWRGGGGWAKARRRPSVERGWGMGKGPEGGWVERVGAPGGGLGGEGVGMGKARRRPRWRGGGGWAKASRLPGWRGGGGWAKASRWREGGMGKGLEALRSEGLGIDPASRERARLPTVPRSEGRGIDPASRERGRLATVPRARGGDRSGVTRTRALAYRPQERGAGDRSGVTRTRALAYRPQERGAGIDPASRERGRLATVPRSEGRGSIRRHANAGASLPPSEARATTRLPTTRPRGAAEPDGRSTRTGDDSRGQL